MRLDHFDAWIPGPSEFDIQLSDKDEFVKPSQVNGAETASVSYRDKHKTETAIGSESDSSIKNGVTRVTRVTNSAKPNNDAGFTGVPPVTQNEIGKGNVGNTTSPLTASVTHVTQEENSMGNTNDSCKPHKDNELQEALPLSPLLPRKTGNTDLHQKFQLSVSGLEHPLPVAEDQRTSVLTALDTLFREHGPHLKANGWNRDNLLHGLDPTTATAIPLLLVDGVTLINVEWSHLEFDTRAGSLIVVRPGLWLVGEDAEDWKEIFEERAAIREYDGGQSRVEAEMAALKEMV